ncbi:MAG TPA: hypothetical protein VK324_12015 [Tepidisphaeraceae bacterium]|nr:hypothetical protein [Tepidisphaeraceae bacterium]
MLDRSTRYPRPCLPPDVARLFDAMGWAHPPQYFNSGVVLFPGHPRRPRRRTVPWLPSGHPCGLRPVRELWGELCV